MPNSTDRIEKPDKAARMVDKRRPETAKSDSPREKIATPLTPATTPEKKNQAGANEESLGKHCVLEKGKEVKSVKRLDEIVGNSADNGGSPMELTPPIVTASKPKAIPIFEQHPLAPKYNASTVAVPRINYSRPIPAIALDQRPLVLATHLVPSLPIDLFEIIAEMIEVATGQAVVLLHEGRVERPVAPDVADIAILPASENWEQGTLLPVSFVFEHRFNKDNSPGVYVDVIVAADCVRNIEEILDLRGYRCAIPDRRKTLGAAGLLFRHLNSKGESPSFFGNTLDSGSQLATLQMVAGKQAEVGVVESPVISCHRRNSHQHPEIHSLYVLESLGPLPPYRFMLNKRVQAPVRDRIKEVLLGVESDEVRMERLRTFGIIGFAEYNEDRYELEDVKSVVTSVPYY